MLETMQNVFRLSVRNLTILTSIITLYVHQPLASQIKNVFVMSAYQNSAWGIADASCAHQLRFDGTLLPFSLCFSFAVAVGQRLYQVLAVSLCSLAARCL